MNCLSSFWTSVSSPYLQRSMSRYELSLQLLDQRFLSISAHASLLKLHVQNFVNHCRDCTLRYLGEKLQLSLREALEPCAKEIDPIPTNPFSGNSERVETDLRC